MRLVFVWYLSRICPLQDKQPVRVWYLSPPLYFQVPVPSRKLPPVTSFSGEDLSKEASIVTYLPCLVLGRGKRLCFTRSLKTPLNTKPLPLFSIVGRQSPLFSLSDALHLRLSFQIGDFSPFSFLQPIALDFCSGALYFSQSPAWNRLMPPCFFDVIFPEAIATVSPCPTRQLLFHHAHLRVDLHEYYLYRYFSDYTHTNPLVFQP